jgi:hypothetical protein
MYDKDTVEWIKDHARNWLNWDGLAEADWIEDPCVLDDEAPLEDGKMGTRRVCPPSCDDLTRRALWEALLDDVQLFVENWQPGRGS